MGTSGRVHGCKWQSPDSHSSSGVRGTMVDIFLNFDAEWPIYDQNHLFTGLKCNTDSSRRFITTPMGSPQTSIPSSTRVLMPHSQLSGIFLTTPLPDDSNNQNTRRTTVFSPTPRLDMKRPSSALRRTSLLDALLQLLL
ncbi:hypothetical protein HDF11_005171 [Tunturiibacter psychrotolerans]